MISNHDLLKCRTGTGNESTMALGNLPLLADLMAMAQFIRYLACSECLGYYWEEAMLELAFWGSSILIAIDRTMPANCGNEAPRCRAFIKSNSKGFIFWHSSGMFFKTPYITSPAIATTTYFWRSSILLVSNMTAWGPNWRKKVLSLSSKRNLDLADLVYRFEIADHLTRRFNKTQHCGIYMKCHVY